MKNNIDYYRHFSGSHQHPKFKMLRVKFGWEGEGKFWALNNMIASSENCWLDLSKKYNKASIAHDLDFTIEELDAFINYLHEECELLLKDGDLVSTQEVRENFDKVSAERERKKTRRTTKKTTKKENVRGTSAEKLENSADKHHKDKGKDKVNESKVNDDVVVEVFEPSSMEILTHEDLQFGNLLNFVKFKNQLLNDPPWKSAFVSQFEVTPDKIPRLLIEFGMAQQSRKKSGWQDIEDFASHFENWLRLRLKKIMNHDQAASNNHIVTTDQAKRVLQQLIDEDEAISSN